MAEVSNVTFQYVLNALQMKTKIPIDDMLLKVDIDKDILNEQNGKIDSDKLTGIFRYCMKETNNPTLSLDLGQSISYHSLGILGYLLLNTKNLKEMIEKFNIYQKLISGHLKFNFNDDGKYYKFTILINENRYIPVPSFHAEVHLSAILNILTQILGQKVIPEFTYFSGKKVEKLQKYEELFGKNIYFEKDENSIFFDKEKLDIPVNNSNPAMLGYFEAQADKILHEMGKDSYYNKVEKEILKNIGDKDITIELIAQNLNLNVRTLQNHLKSESKKFTEALSNVRKKLSEHYIKNTRMDDTTIAILLGYSEVSSFYRAYKKWNGFSPKQFRKECNRRV